MADKDRRPGADESRKQKAVADMASPKGRDRYRSSKPSLSDVLAETDADAVVVTIKEVKDQTFAGDAPGKDRLALVIVTDEYPENGWFPNAGRGGSVDRLYDKLGDDQAAWIGERLPLVRVRDVYNPQTGNRSDKFHAAKVEADAKGVVEWDDILAQADGKRTRVRTPVAAASRPARSVGRPKGRVK